MKIHRRGLLAILFGAPMVKPTPVAAASLTHPELTDPRTGEPLMLSGYSQTGFASDDDGVWLMTNGKIQRYSLDGTLMETL